MHVHVRLFECLLFSVDLWQKLAAIKVLAESDFNKATELKEQRVAVEMRTADQATLSIERLSAGQPVNSKFSAE